MASPMLSFVVLLLVLMKQTDGSLRLEVNPTEITPSLTESLTVNCSFSFAGVTNMSGIIALIVSESAVNGSQFEDLVSVNVFTPDELTILPGVDGTVSGHIDSDSESFLSIVWTYPTSSKTCIYRCEVHGMDNVGHPTEMFLTTHVISQQSNLDKLTEKVSELQHQLQGQETLAKNQSVEINQLSTLARNQSVEINQISTLAKNQADELNQLSTLAKNLSDEIETLVSLTKSQSEIISTHQSQLDSQSHTITKILSKLSAICTFHMSSKHNNHYYLLSKEDFKDVNVSQRTCHDYGGYLAQINDDNENQFVKDFLNHYVEIDTVLVSGTDANHEGQWSFTGTEIDLVFTNWESGYPRHDQSKNCIGLNIRWDWRWWDWPCTGSFSKFKFLCEVELV